MKLYVKKTIKVVLVLACFDALGVIGMIIFPDLTDKIIPLLALVQLLGIIGFSIMFFVWFPQQVENERQQEASVPENVSTRPYRKMATWIIYGAAFFFLLRALIAIATTSQGGWHKSQMIALAESIIIAAFLIIVVLRVKWSKDGRSSKGR